MRAIAILGPDVSPEHLSPFLRDVAGFNIQDFGQPLKEGDVALVLGGDGTIHRHLAPLSERRIPVLMVPRGSGNDFAQALGFHSEHESLAAWEKFRAGGDNVREIDLGCIRPLGGTATPGGERKQVLFCNIGGAGLDAEANRRANAMPRWLRRRGGYLLGALAAIGTFGPHWFSITAGTRSVQRRGLLVAFANGPAYGGGIRIAPQADLADGKLDICFVRQVGRARLLRLFPSVFSGSHLNHPEVEYFQAERLLVETESPLDVYADGEYVCQTPVEVSVAPRALRVIVPESRLQATHH